MKHPTGYAKPRRLAAPRKKVRLDLKRRPQPEPEGQWPTEQKSNFGQWVLLVALFHVIVIAAVWWIYENASTSQPPEEFISLLPAGDTVKGTPGAQEAHKLGPTTPAPVRHASAPPPALAVHQSKPILPKPAPTPAILKPNAPIPLADQPVAPAKPAPPKPPKVKVDLTLADAPTPAPDKPKPKLHHKKPAPKPIDETEDQDQASAVSESTGLSREQIAAKLGEKLDTEGVKSATNSGTSGSDHAKANPFAEFYAMLHDQVMEQWTVPNLSDDSAVNPIVGIHVEKDGRVAPESVHLIQSSGNSTYDESALTAAKGLGYLREPLPDGCPPDISITFKPNR